MTYQQPQPTANMAVGTNNTATREFHHGLFGCGADCGTFLLSWCCPCITYGRISRRLAYLQANGNRPDPEHGGCVGGDCLLHGVAMSFGFGWVLQCLQREKLRSKYGIDGGGCTDCLAACCCTPCELTQESLELDYVEDPSHQQQYGKA